jgi:dTDP-4-amino-4,6-dideoxygalactose transaminase
MPFYRERNGFQEDDFPETMKMFRQEVSLPIWAGMTDDQIKYVTHSVHPKGV